MMMNRTLDRHLPVDRDEMFMTRIYAGIDDATSEELDRVWLRDGVKPTCHKGCSSCCSQHILVSPLEAHALICFIRRTFSAGQIDELKIRTRQWHAWDGLMPGRFPGKHPGWNVDLSHYDHHCPLNVDGACIAYQARPMVCRIHYVSSPALACRALNVGTLKRSVPQVMASVKSVTEPFQEAVRERIERAGRDYSRSLMTLPHWLGDMMGWMYHG